MPATNWAADLDCSDLHALDGYGLGALCFHYPLESGKVWTLPVSKRQIMIRKHHKRLFQLMCHDMKLGDIGIKQPSQSKALLAGSPGTGKSMFMWIAAISFMKMMKADPLAKWATGELRAPKRTTKLKQLRGKKHLDVVVFNPWVTSICLRWSSMVGGKPVWLGEKRPSHLTTVHLYDAGVHLDKLPGTGSQMFALATSPADPTHYEGWVAKDSVVPRYSMALTAEEMEELAGLRGKRDVDWRGQFDTIRGHAGAVFELGTDSLAKYVRDLVLGLPKSDYRNVAQMVWLNTVDPGKGTLAFSVLYLRPAHKADPEDGFGDYQGYTVRPNKRETACVSTLTTALLRCCVVVFVDLGDVFLDRSRTRIHARRGNAPSGGHQGWEDGP